MDVELISLNEVIAIYLSVISHLDKDHVPVSKLIVSDRLLSCKETLRILFSDLLDDSYQLVNSAEVLFDEARRIGLGTIQVYKINNHDNHNGNQTLDLLLMYDIKSMQDSYSRRQAIKSYLCGNIDRLEVIYHSIHEDRMNDISAGHIFLRMPHEDLLLMSFFPEEEFDEDLRQQYERFIDELIDWDIYLTKNRIRTKEEIIEVIKDWLNREFGSENEAVDKMKIVLMMPGGNVIPIRPQANL